MVDETTRECRRNLMTQSTCTFVGPDEFQILAVSNRRLWRSNDPAAGVRGLLDPETGKRYVTEEEKLFLF